MLHWRMESQVCGFVAGDQVTLDQLLHRLLVYSGNDAASAIAEYVGGSTENFVQMMNDYAAKLGCTGTHFPIHMDCRMKITIQHHMIFI